SDQEKMQFRSVVSEVFDRLRQSADNAGTTDGDRARNYLSVRYPAIYTKAADFQQQGYSLTAVDTLPSRLSGVRRLVDVIFTFTQRNTTFMEKLRIRVDVTGEFPFLDASLSVYYDH